jgi:hypothetical protein
MKPILGSLLATLALAGVAWAEGGAGSSRWEVNSSLLDKSDGCFYVVEGHAPGLPEGTSLHVNLTTAGTGPNTLRAAFFKVVVKGNGEFTGSFHWPNKRFAPLIYTTKVELYVNSQAPGVRRTLMREFGYPANAREMVAEEQIEHGEDNAARLAFSLAGLTEAEGLVEKCQGLRQTGAEILAAGGDTWWDRWEAECMPHLLEFQADLRKFEGEYVIRRESDLVHEVRNVTTDLIQTGTNLVSDPSFPAAETMAQLDDRLKAVLNEIESRRPLDPNAIEDDEEFSEESGEQSDEGETE